MIWAQIHLQSNTMSISMTYDVRRHYTGWSIKKGNPLLVAILKHFLEVINVSVHIFGKFRHFYVSGEEIMGKDAIISLLRLFEHI